MIERAIEADVLLHPARATVTREKNRPGVTDNPTAFVAHEVDVYQLHATRRALPAPRLAAVVRVDKNTVNYTLLFADRADDPAFFLTRKAHAVQLDVCAFKLFWSKDSRLRPTRAVASDKDGIAREEEACFFVTEVDVVYAGFGADVL